MTTSVATTASARQRADAVSGGQTAAVRMLWRGLTLACPVCGGRGLFRRWGLFAMRERCPGCDLKFERMEGHWLGAVAVNTVVSATAVILAVVAAMLVWGTDASHGLLLAIRRAGRHRGAGAVRPGVAHPVDSDRHAGETSEPKRLWLTDHVGGVAWVAYPVGLHRSGVLAALAACDA